MASRFLDLAAGKPQSSKPLMGIPNYYGLKLCNCIYSFVALSDKGTHPRHVPISRDGNYAALTRVCRKIRTEYLPFSAH